ncbi:MAG: hypothetical protein K0S65_1836, partial [Labilithrix sp.]|nr:hypothetical protein [Labilithrix sp.]
MLPSADPHDAPAEFSEDRGSSRSLDEIGAVTVLGAMVEQRRRSSIPAASEVEDVLDADA